MKNSFKRKWEAELQTRSCAKNSLLCLKPHAIHFNFQTMYTYRKDNDTCMFKKIDNTIINTVKNFSFITTWWKND